MKFSYIEQQELTENSHSSNQNQMKCHRNAKVAEKKLTHKILTVKIDWEKHRESGNLAPKKRILNFSKNFHKSTGSNGEQSGTALFLTKNCGSYHTVFK